MSIRYTIRHNIPHEKIEAEDVNDSSTWDLNLIRKHELAETDEHDIVYRQHDGKIVSWAKAATQHAQEISDQVDERFNEITTEAALLELKLQEIEEEASSLTEEAHEAVESANIAIIKAETAKQESETNAENSEQNYFLAKDWATKTNGKVIENEEEVDYSSKYYAQQSASSAQSASTSAEQAQQAATTAAQDAAQNAVEDVSDLLSEYVTSAQTSASTANTKAEEASTSASDALQAKQDAISARGDAISASNTAIDAKDTAVSASNSASNSATSAQTSASSASSSAATATTKATEASESATSAAQSATSASGSASTATSAATSATQSATNASASATSAQTSSENAQQAKEDAEDYANLSKDWAIKTDGKVSNEDYSSKYYAGQAQSAASTAATQASQEVRSQLAQYVTDTTDAADRAEQALEEIDTIIEGGGYLPVTGGTISGNLSVSGTITGNLTGTPTAPTPTAGDNSTKIATTEFVQDAIDSEETRADGKYLPLSGGTMTGNIALANMGQISNSVDDGYIRINGGTDDNHGARFVANGMSRAGNVAGQFECVASNGTNTVTLKGTPDGGLLWNGLTLSLPNGTYDLVFYGFGYITASGTSLDMSFPYIVKGKDIRFNSLVAVLRSYKGYLSPGGVGGSDILTGSTQGTWYEKNSRYPCAFRLVRSGGWGANGENNTVVVGEFTANVTVTDV